MRRMFFVGALLHAALYGTQVMAADDRCGGVLMSNRSAASPHHKKDAQELGFYSTYGGLLMNGESTCTSVRIECERKSGICRTATAVTASLLGRAQVVAVSMSYDYNVT